MGHSVILVGIAFALGVSVAAAGAGDALSPRVVELEIPGLKDSGGGVIVADVDDVGKPIF